MAGTHTAQTGGGDGRLPGGPAPCTQAGVGQAVGVRGSPSRSGPWPPSAWAGLVPMHRVWGSTQCGWEKGGPQVGVGLITSPRALTGCPGGRDMVRKAPAARGQVRGTRPQLHSSGRSTQDSHPRGSQDPCGSAGRQTRDHRELALSGCGRTGLERSQPATAGGLEPSPEPARTGRSCVRTHLRVETSCCFRLTPTPPGARAPRGPGEGDLGLGSVMAKQAHPTFISSTIA